ncbi:aspartate aminotransferase [Candidatus Omnitrophus magneticus]|uniref:Aminotransferase n=1 Tax=Candidatus Omnitrophus magneticus TaxID=1609969 RepID=A0A0F0CW74_9BACT|nr:aspartate aminotransferase [Candidatus Omnitrophus magneticus]
MKFPKKIESIKPSDTLDITARAKAMIKEGKDIVILAAGEPDFDTPDIIKESAIKAIKDGFTKYTPSAGTVSLREAIRQKLKKENNLDYELDEIVVSNGAKHSLYNIFQVICQEGDEVIVIHPYWLSYPEMVKLAGAKPVIIKTSLKNNFKVSISDLEKKITKKTKAIILNSPSNPAGVVYAKEELRSILDLCARKDILIISDEIYEKIMFDGNTHNSIGALSTDAKKRTILVNGVSKSYAMTGWRIGYAAGDKDIMKRIVIAQSHATSNPCSISQVASECALKSDLNNFFEEKRAEFEKRRDVLISRLSGIDAVKIFKPSGAFYLFCDISKTGLDSVTFSKRLLEEKGVAVIPGLPFGEDKFIRISFASAINVIEKGADRIKSWIEGLK